MTSVERVQRHRAKLKLAAKPSASKLLAENIRLKKRIAGLEAENEQLKDDLRTERIFSRARALHKPDVFNIHGEPV